MANQVVTVVETQLPHDPDIGALSQMQAPIVMVHKITRGEKNKEGAQLVINGLTGMSLGDILKLQDVLPLGTVYPNSGPGIYRFSVTDGESAAKCTWQTRLGSAVGDTANPGAPMATLPFGTPLTASAVRPVPAPPPPAPMTLPSGVRAIGNGFYYDDTLELLTAPDGTAHPWRKGQPLPAAVTTPATLVAPAAPLSHIAGPGTSFFAAAAPELEATKAALAASQRALEELQRQQAQDRLEAMHQKEMADLRDSIKGLAERLSSSPRENPEIVDLKRRLERQDELAALRAETKATTDTILEVVRGQSRDRGVDPIVTMLLKSSEDMVRAVRDAASEERRTFTAMLDRQALAAEKAAANNPMEKIAGVFDVLVDKFGRVMQLEREFSGSGGGVDWVSAIKELGSKAGSAVAMYQQAKAAEAQATTETARAQIARAKADIVKSQTAVALHGSATPAVAPRAVRPVAAAKPGLPSAKPEIPNLEKATLKELRSIFNAERDEVFFGKFLEYVKQLRTAIAAAPSDFSAKKIAEVLMQAREAVAEEAAAGRTTHAAEIWAYGQIAYLLERLLPETSEGLRSEVVKALTLLQAEEDDANRIAANSAGDAGEEVATEGGDGNAVEGTAESEEG